MKRTLFFSSLLALSIALSGCVGYNPYGPYAFYGHGQQYGKNLDINFNGAYALSGYPGAACAPMVCEPACDPCVTPMNYAYGTACDPCATPVCSDPVCSTPCATPGVATATSLSWLARIMRGTQYPCHGCGDEVYWGDYGQTPDDVCNPCTYDGKWAGNTDRRAGYYDPCGGCGHCNVCQQGTSFRHPAIGTYMNRLYAPVFQDKIAPTHGTAPLDYGLRDPGPICAASCVDPCVEPCVTPCVEPCAPSCVCKTGGTSQQQIANHRVLNPAPQPQLLQPQVLQPQLVQPQVAQQYVMNPAPAQNVPTQNVPTAPANDTLRSFLARTFAKPKNAQPYYPQSYYPQSYYPQHYQQPVYTAAAYQPQPQPQAQAQAQPQPQAPAQQLVAANTTLRNSAPNAVCNTPNCRVNHQTQAQANPKPLQNSVNHSVYQNAVHRDEGTTLSTALPVSHVTR